MKHGKLTPFQTGYLMGLIVGEGSFTGDRRDPCLSVKLHEADPLPLLALQRSLGGKIYGPYHNKAKDGGPDRHYTIWRLRGKALRALLPLIERHLPPSRKREQFEVWLSKYGLESIVRRQMRLLFVVEHSTFPKKKQPLPQQQLRIVP